MSTVDWAVFDCDGTLADTLACFVDTFDEAAEHFGFARFKRERIQELKALDVGGMLRGQDPVARGGRRRVITSGRDLAGFAGLGRRRGREVPGR